MRTEAPQQRLRDKDKTPRGLSSVLYGYEVGACANYDITLNSGTLGIDKRVEILKDPMKVLLEPVRP